MASSVLSLWSLDGASNWHLNVFPYLLLSEASSDELCVFTHCSNMEAQAWHFWIQSKQEMGGKSAGENDFWFGLCSVEKLNPARVLCLVTGVE